MDKDIPNYNDSYTEDENKTIHKFLESASENELIESIINLISLYPDVEKVKIKKELGQLLGKIHNRVIMKEKYETLLECKES